VDGATIASASFHHGQHLGRPGGFGGCEFGDVGAAMKCGPPQVRTIAFTRVGNRALDAVENTAADGGAQRVHRRTVDRHNGDDVTTLEFTTSFTRLSWIRRSSLRYSWLGCS